jgi:hypothetical protein
MRRRHSPQRGCNKPAQGNALDLWFPNFIPALKGRNNAPQFVSPFQDFSIGV